MEKHFVIAVMVAVLCAGLAGILGYTISQTAGERESLKARIVTVEQENTQLKSQLEQLKTSDADLQRNYDALKTSQKTTPAKRAAPAARRRKGKTISRAR